MAGKYNFQEEERDYKFDARLRYVENLINAWHVFLQAESDRCTKELNPKEYIVWQKALMNLYRILSLHDDELKKPNFSNITESYIDELLNHEVIKELTQNKMKKDDPNQAIKKKFSV